MNFLREENQAIKKEIYLYTIVLFIFIHKNKIQ